MKAFVLSVAMFASVTYSHGAVLVSWTTEGLSGAQSIEETLEPASVSPLLEEGTLLKRHRLGALGLSTPSEGTVTEMLVANRWRSGGSSPQPEQPSTRQDAISGERYFTFTITPKAGNTMALSSLSFEIKRQGSTSPAEFQWAYLIGDATEPVFIGSSSWSHTGADARVHTISLSGVGDLQHLDEEVSFRLYGWGATVQAAWAGFSAEYGPSVELEGEITAIPEPTAFLLLGGCALFGVARWLTAAH